MELQSARLTIRPFVPTDDKRMLEAMACPDIHQMHSDGFPDIEAVRRYLRLLTDEYQSGLFRTLAIADRESSILIGAITLDRIPAFARVELSYWIHPAQRNRGYATEAVTAIIHHCFQTADCNRIQAMTANPASARVLDKSGMRYEGTLRQYVGMNGVFRDMAMYAILRSDIR